MKSVSDESGKEGARINWQQSQNPRRRKPHSRRKAVFRKGPEANSGFAGDAHTRGRFAVVDHVSYIRDSVANITKVICVNRPQNDCRETKDDIAREWSLRQTRKAVVTGPEDDRSSCPLLWHQQCFKKHRDAPASSRHQRVLTSY